MQNLETAFAEFKDQNKKAKEAAEVELNYEVKVANERYRLEMKKLLKDLSMLPTERKFRMKHAMVKSMESNTTLKKLCIVDEDSQKFFSVFDRVRTYYYSEQTGIFSQMRSTLFYMLVKYCCHNFHLQEFEVAYSELLKELHAAKESVDVKNKSAVTIASDSYRSKMQQLFDPSKPLLYYWDLQAEHHCKKCDARDLLCDKIIKSVEKDLKFYLSALDEAINNPITQKVALNTFI